ncbi:MAG: hypothetical protein EP343_26710 [Deltaproteobacteria bacterium]|nr:MAG: hypothetical protein EP343_26710 [Deltaproteobacteria bacterium]
MSDSTLKLSYTETLSSLQNLLDDPTLVIALDPERHTISVQDPRLPTHKQVRLAPIFPAIQTWSGHREGEPYSPLPRPESLSEYLQRVSPEFPTFALILMQAGQAALGLVEDDEWLHHKVIRKYMVRKKQGKAQLTHLRQKGKSRVGSRIRLANSVAFFEEINERLAEWDVTNLADVILYSTTGRLWGHLFRASEPCPFPSDDPRLRKIPMHVHTPTFAELERVRNAVQYSEWTTNPASS